MKVFRFGFWAPDIWRETYNGVFVYNKHTVFGFFVFLFSFSFAFIVEFIIVLFFNSIYIFKFAFSSISSHSSPAPLDKRNKRSKRVQTYHLLTGKKNELIVE